MKLRTQFLIVGIINILVFSSVFAAEIFKTGYEKDIRELESKLKSRPEMVPETSIEGKAIYRVSLSKDDIRAMVIAKSSANNIVANCDTLLSKIGAEMRQTASSRAMSSTYNALESQYRTLLNIKSLASNLQKDADNALKAKGVLQITILYYKLLYQLDRIKKLIASLPEKFQKSTMTVATYAAEDAVYYASKGHPEIQEIINKIKKYPKSKPKPEFPMAEKEKGEEAFATTEVFASKRVKPKREEPVKPSTTDIAQRFAESNLSIVLKYAEKFKAEFKNIDQQIADDIKRDQEHDMTAIGELQALKQEFPTLTDDIDILIDKYTKINKSVLIAKFREAFLTLERAKAFERFVEENKEIDTKLQTDLKKELAIGDIAIVSSYLNTLKQPLLAQRSEIAQLNKKLQENIQDMVIQRKLPPSTTSKEPEQLKSLSSGRALGRTQYFPMPQLPGPVTRESESELLSKLPPHPTDAPPPPPPQATLNPKQIEMVKAAQLKTYEEYIKEAEARKKNTTDRFELQAIDDEIAAYEGAIKHIKATGVGIKN